MPTPVTLLVDNGSLQPAATLALRGLAVQLSTRLGQLVEAVSLLHSSGIDPQLIGGAPAEILFPALEKRLAAGQTDFVIVPLFFGPSQALTVYMPENIARLQAKYAALRVRVAPELFASGDDRLARILADQVRKQIEAVSSRASSLPQKGRPFPRVALVDHGSPVKVVTDVRNELACQLSGLLGPEYQVAPASMERRENAAYNFCEPLLAKLLRSPDWNSGEVIIAMQFLLPGRHAGPEGDVAEICRDAEAACAGALRTTMTDLVGAHPLLIDILADRWRAVTKL